MKNSYMIILIALVCLIFAACNRNKNNTVLPNNILPSNDNESTKESNERNDIDENREINIKEIKPIDDIDADDYTDTLAGDTDIENPNVASSVIESEPPVHYYIVGNGVRMREAESLEADILVLLSSGTRVEYIDRKGDWIKVKYDKRTGYIRNDMLSETEPNEGRYQEDLEVSDNSRELLDNPKIIVKKADRILQLWEGDNLWATYQVGLGWEPEGDKKKEGDGKTPEGIYYVCTRNNYSRFYLSLGLSYPNIEDALEALDADLIDQRTYNQIEDAINRGVQPPWNTALGGEIMIHGHGSHADWTAGCIAVDNNIMDILWANCKLGTTVLIEP